MPSKPYRRCRRTRASAKASPSCQTSIGVEAGVEEVVAEGELAHDGHAVGRPVPHRHRHPLARGHFGTEEAIGAPGATAARSRPWPAGKRPGIVTGSFPPIGASPQRARAAAASGASPYS